MEPIEATKELLALFKNIQQIIREHQILFPRSVFRELQDKLQLTRTFITELSLRESTTPSYTGKLRDSHYREVRNWLTVIVGHAEQMQKHQFSKIEIKGRLSAIILSAWSIARLLDR